MQWLDSRTLWNFRSRCYKIFHFLFRSSSSLNSPMTYSLILRLRGNSRRMRVFSSFFNLSGVEWYRSLKKPFSTTRRSSSAILTIMTDLLRFVCSQVQVMHTRKLFYPFANGINYLILIDHLGCLYVSILNDSSKIDIRTFWKWYLSKFILVSKLAFRRWCQISYSLSVSGASVQDAGAEPSGCGLNSNCQTYWQERNRSVIGIIWRSPDCGCMMFFRHRLHSERLYGTPPWSLCRLDGSHRIN